MDYNKAALEMHETHKGKVGIVSKVEVATRDDLSTAYTPGVAEPCRKIKENPDDVYKYTFKGNMVAVVSNGTAVLGLGDIGPEAGLPVMEGKAVLFKEFGGVDAFPICIDAHDAAGVIAACKAIAPTFGGINLEDIKSPECFEIEETLERELDIPVFHDDQHGTAIVVTAALINALRVVGKKMEDVHIVLNGPGAAGTAIIKMLMTAGAKDIIAVDQFGTLYKGCNSAEAHKNWLGEMTQPPSDQGRPEGSAGGRRCVHRCVPPRHPDHRTVQDHEQGRHRLCHGQPHPGDHAGRSQGRRRAGDSYRPQRLPQSGQQRVVLPRPVQGCTQRPRPGYQQRDEAGCCLRHCGPHHRC